MSIYYNLSLFSSYFSKILKSISFMFTTEWQGEQGGLAHDIILETDSTSSFKPFSEKKVTQEPRKKIKNYAWKVHCWSL